MSIFKRGVKWPEDMTERFTVIRDNKELEVCVGCGHVTDIEFKTPLNERKGYREGVGQLCDLCDEECGHFYRGC